MGQDTLPGMEPPSRPAGRVAKALEEALRDDASGAFARRYPVAAEVAGVMARALDEADAKHQAAMVAQLAKSAVLVFAPLGLAPDPESHPGDPLAQGAEPKESHGGPLAGVSRPTLVHPAAS